MITTCREVVVDQKHAAWPNGIALDIEARQLYYVDAYLAVINRVDYDGGTPTQIVSGSLQHPFGFDLLGEFLMLFCAILPYSFAGPLPNWKLSADSRTNRSHVPYARE